MSIRNPGYKKALKPSPGGKLTFGNRNSGTGESGLVLFLSGGGEAVLIPLYVT